MAKDTAIEQSTPIQISALMAVSKTLCGHILRNYGHIDLVGSIRRILDRAYLCKVVVYLFKQTWLDSLH